MISLNFVLNNFCDENNSRAIMNVIKSTKKKKSLLTSIKLQNKIQQFIDDFDSFVMDDGCESQASTTGKLRQSSVIKMSHRMAIPSLFKLKISLSF